MIKPTPNPPETETSPYESLDSRKLHDAAERALDHYLKPNGTGQKPRTPSAMFQIVGDMDNESLLAHACESLASASVMTNDIAAHVESPQRHTILAIAQIIMLAELAVNRGWITLKWRSPQSTPEPLVGVSLLAISEFQTHKC